MLPDVIVIGAMKCGTTAIHGYLDAHPEIGMARRKELNFFFAPEDSPGQRTGNWHRGLRWYRAQFPSSPLRGEASPAYTSPSFPEVARRMAVVVPDVRLVYLVRDPIERAVSQYRHHRADGTEARPIDQALLDPSSQYISRSRFFARLEPYLEHFGGDRIFVLSQEELVRSRRRALRALYRFLGVDHSFSSPEIERRCRIPAERGRALLPEVRRRLAASLSDDAARLRDFAGRQFAGWSL